MRSPGRSPVARQALDTEPRPLRVRLEERWTALRKDLERELERVLDPRDAEVPALVDAMRYSVMAGGKRFRPLVAALAAEFAGGSGEAALGVGVALELVHTFSLVHDDLPSMDNDELRRGRPTSHIVHGEAQAILAGDALQSMAFEVLGGGYPPAVAGRLAGELARALGAGGMCGGQSLDLEAAGGRVGPDELEKIHRLKTGALITASAVMGGIAAGAGREDLDMLRSYGRALGLVFQITDDILDETQPAEALGKTPGKDVRDSKATYPAVFGLEGAAERARAAADKARQTLERAGPRAELLVELAAYVLQRTK
jgi:geranylgeranyl pyrophosphate synthase